MKVLVTGVDGYLGAVLGPDLLAHGHDVTGVDTGFYRRGWLYAAGGDQPRTRRADIRALEPSDLAGFDAVVHLAELSNDPLGQFAPRTTKAINHAGSVHLAEVARRAGVQRFVYMSSCSVYGVAEDDVDEASPVDPQTVYAECKVLVERDVSALAGDDFSPTFLRNATAFGASPRMRFDIVLNNLAGLAWTTQEITMTSDGSPWRPLVHALDIAQAIRCVLDAPREVVHREVFNVGANDQNYRVRDIAEVVADVFEGCSLRFGPPDQDNRSYRVRFDKIEGQLPGFACTWDARRGAEQLRTVFEAIGLDEATFRAPEYTRLAELQRLLSTGQLTDTLEWRVSL